MEKSSKISYKTTAIACYLGNFTQSIIINLTPVIFIPLKEIYNLSYTQLGSLVLVNFLTQILVDIILSRVADKYGFRFFTLLGQGFAIVGLALFALSPFLFPSRVYGGLIVSTIIFSGGGGLMEMLLSPIVDSIPTDVKSTAMSVLHSFYAWGQLSVIVLTTLLIFLVGENNWPYIVAGWIIIPIIDFVLFLNVPFAAPVQESDRMRMIDYLKNPFFIIAFFAILLGGATEVSMAQWASAFMERGLSLPKISGDLLGLAAFALFLAIGRTLYGKYGTKIDVHKVMIIGAFISIFCYLVVALSPYAPLSLIACATCGIAVTLLWPGTLVISSEKFPFAGASMFAILAAGGDMGASFGPWIISFVTDNVSRIPSMVNLANKLGLTLEQFGLRAGILIGTIFPILCFMCHIWLKKHKS